MKNKYQTRYTDKEENFIRVNYSKMSNKRIGEALNNRTAWTIKKKMQSMGISRKWEQTKKIILDSKRKYPHYAMNNQTWRPMVTLSDGKRILKSHHILLGKPAPKGYVVHHKDMNPRNNSKNNLMLMSKAEHNKLHTSNDGIYGQLKMEGKI